MTKALRTLRRALADLVAGDGSSFKGVDASPAQPHDASWLTH